MQFHICKKRLLNRDKKKQLKDLKMLRDGNIIMDVLISATAGLTCNDQDRRKWTVRRQRRKCFVDCGGCFSK